MGFALLSSLGRIPIAQRALVASATRARGRGDKGWTSARQHSPFRQVATIAAAQQRNPLAASQAKLHATTEVPWGKLRSGQVFPGAGISPSAPRQICVGGRLLAELANSLSELSPLAVEWVPRVAARVRCRWRAVPPALPGLTLLKT